MECRKVTEKEEREKFGRGEDTSGGKRRRDYSGKTQEGDKTGGKMERRGGNEGKHFLTDRQGREREGRGEVDRMTALI